MQGINNKYLLTIKLLEETFRSHNLSRDSFIFAVDTVLRLSLSDELIAQFVAVACKKTNTGMFALTYNSQLDTAINSRNTESINVLVVNPFFPELFDNTGLDDIEFKNVSRFVRIEYKSVLAVLKRGTKLITTSMVNIFEPIIESSVDIATEGEVRKGAGIYTKCHEEVCYYDIGDSNPPPSSIQPKMLVPDIGKDFDVPFVHCFDRMEIIQSLAGGSKINPRTGKAFSETSFKLLNDKLHTEVKLYTWYLTHGNNYQLNVKKDSVNRITRPSS